MTNTPEIFVVGSLNFDLVLPVERLPQPGETLAAGDLETFSGGKGANQACAAARMGGRVSMVGQVGYDASAARLIESLEAAGADTSRIGRCRRPTGSASIMVLPNGENAILVSPGANAALTPPIVLAQLGALRPENLVLFQLEIPLESVHEGLAHAKRHGATTILDPAPARRLSSGLLAHVDILTPNETEALALLTASGNKNPADARAAEQLAVELLSLGPATVILKLGPRGCFIATNQERFAVPGFPVKALDTTAAGDTFNGALAAALAEGQTLNQATRFANAAAALAVTRRGAQSSIPTRPEVEHFLRNNNN